MGSVKSFFLIVLVSFLTSTTAQSQRGQSPKPGSGIKNESNKEGRVEALRIAFITKSMDLSPEEAQRFWPCYNTYLQEMKVLKKRRKKLLDIQDIGESITDDEALKILDEDLDLARKEFELKLKYNDLLIRLVPPSKMFKLHRAEEMFKRRLLNEIQKTSN